MEQVLGEGCSKGMEEKKETTDSQGVEGKETSQADKTDKEVEKEQQGTLCEQQ